jgi:hypothetical protein
LYEGEEHIMDLAHRWDGSFFKTDIPLGAIRNYFGSKIAMYFSFASFNARHLIWPGVIGVVVFIF